MTTKLSSISRSDTVDVYDVSLEVDGQRRSMRCRVVEHTGLRVVQPTPDLLSTLSFPPSLLVAAVLAFDAAARIESDRSSTE